MHRTAALRIAIWGIFWSLAILAAHRTLAQPPDEPAPRRASGTAESAKAGRTADLPRGQWTDVLKLVELKKRSAVGPWRSKEKTLVLEDPESPARVVIPVAPGGSYNLKIEFTRTDGDGTVGVILPVGARQCLAALNYKGGPSGLDMINDHHANDNASTAPGACPTTAATVWRSTCGPTAARRRSRSCSTTARSSSTAARPPRSRSPRIGRSPAAPRWDWAARQASCSTPSSYGSTPAPPAPYRKKISVAFRSAKGDYKIRIDLPG